MKYLERRGMQNMLRLKLGRKLLYISFENRKCYGIGMEFFEHESLNFNLQKINTPQCLTCFIPQRSRYQILLSKKIRELYRLCIEAMFRMWILGIIHRQLSVAAVLYDKQRKEVKIVDFFKAVMPETLKSFQLGVLADLSWFTMTFVLATLNPEYLNSREKFQNIDQEVISYIRTTSIEMNPDLGQVSNGRLPSSPEWAELWSSFQRISPATSVIEPSSEEIQRSFDWKFAQSTIGYRGQRLADMMARINQVILYGVILPPALPDISEVSELSSNSEEGFGPGTELQPLRDARESISFAEASSSGLSKREGKKKALPPAEPTVEMARPDSDSDDELMAARTHSSVIEVGIPLFVFGTCEILLLCFRLQEGTPLSHEYLLEDL